MAAALAESSPEARELGLYVHVPFCAKRCGYCSFNTAPLEDGAMARYLEAFHREIELLGRLAWVGVTEGSQVKENQIIARLESADYEAALLAANATVAELDAQHVQAERDLKRAQSLRATT